MNLLDVKALVGQPNEDIISFVGSVYYSSWIAEQLAATDTLSTLETVSELAFAMKLIVDSSSSREKKMELLLAYPDLCHKAQQGGGSELSKESQEEQARSGLESLTKEELESFLKLNNSYREQFGFPFILAVRNATKYTVFAALERRVRNPPEVEFAAAIQQVHKIAWMRLLTKLDTSGC